MDIRELLEYLDLDSPAEFEYFEHMADLLELEDDVSYEACYALFACVPPDTLCELLTNYFEEIMENLPDETVDIFTLLTTIRQCLLGLAKSVDVNETRRQFCEEFLKFRNWYSLDSKVHCKRISDGLFSDATVAEALALCRLEKLNEAAHRYDFTDCLDYEIDEYSMSLSDLLPDFDEDEHHRHHQDEEEYEEDDDAVAYAKGLIDRDNPVIDAEDATEAYEDEYDDEYDG